MSDPRTGALDGLLPADAVSAEDLALMRRIDELHLDHPFAGARMLRDLLRPMKAIRLADGMCRH